MPCESLLAFLNPVVVFLGTHKVSLANNFTSAGHIWFIVKGLSKAQDGPRVENWKIEFTTLWRFLRNEELRAV